MKYAYKIVGNFTDENFEKITKKASKKFLIIYLDGAMFLALKSWQDYEGSEDLISQTFKPVRDFYIEEVNLKNINKLYDFTKDWCMNNLTRLDGERYEAENQDKLKQAWLAMDNMEEELKQMTKNNLENLKENLKEKEEKEERKEDMPNG